MEEKRHKAIYKIQRFSIHDGPGIRTTLFFQGCPLSCFWCHNPESQIPLTQEEKNVVASVVKEAVSQIRKDEIFYEQSSGGVTFSGGEPLMQPDLLFRLAKECRDLGIHTCLDTSGYADPKMVEASASRFDLILYDLKLIEESAHQKYTRRPIGPVLDNLVILSKKKTPLRIRFPMIPGITDTPSNIESLLDFLTDHTIYRDIHILPLHKAAKGKYQQLKKENKVDHLDVPTKAQVADLAKKFESKGFNVFIGG